MGVKAIKEKYRIEHIVQKRDGNICIGSGYISEIIVINADGKIIKRYEDRNNDDLKRYMKEMLVDEGPELKRLFHCEDTFGPTIPCFSHKRGRVIEKRCEVFGWPNTTTDGELMYENNFFLTRVEALRDLRHDSRLGVKCAAENVYRAITEESARICRLSKRLVKNVWYFILAWTTWRRA